MWKPIYHPEPWPQYLKKKENIGVPLMEVRKKYLKEQLLFENYMSSLQQLNVLSPSVGAGGAGGGPNPSSAGSSQRGADLALAADVVFSPGKTISGRLFYLDGGEIGGVSFDLKTEVFPSSSLTRYDWKYPYEEVGTNHPYGWSRYFRNSPSDVSDLTSSLVPTPDTWASTGIPDLGGDNPNHVFSEAYINYENFISNSFSSNYIAPVNIPDYDTRTVPIFSFLPYDSIAYTRPFPSATSVTVTEYTFDSPFRIDYGDGTVNSYEPGVYTYLESEDAVPLSPNLSDSWSLDYSPPKDEEGVIRNHSYDLEFLVPQEWVPYIPDRVPNPINPSSYLADASRGNTYSRITREAAATSSEGNYPWGGPWNNWWEFSSKEINVKVYTNSGKLPRFHDSVKRVNYLDISNATSFNRLFSSAVNVDISPLNISEWDTSNITDLSSMFNDSLFTFNNETDDLSNWDTSNVTNFSDMFSCYYDYNQINPGDIGQWDVSSGENFRSMFSNSVYYANLAGSLMTSDLSNWDMSNATELSTMFFGNGAMQHNTNFNNWNVSGSAIGFMFYNTSFNQPLTNWVPQGNCASAFSFSAMSHTNFWITLDAWASSSAENVNFSNSYYRNTLGYTPSRAYSKQVDNITGNTIGVWGHPHIADDDSAINYADYYKWFNTWARDTNPTCISGSNNHKTYQRLIEKGWTMGSIDIIDTGSIASSRVTQLPVHVTVDSGEYVMTSSYWTPVSEIQEYDNYDHLYTPTLTYRFDQSDSSNTGHPLKFSETLDGTHGGGIEYTVDVTSVGTPGTSGSYTDVVVSKLNGFEVEHKPKLYAYCENHSGMSEFYLETYI